MSKLDVVVKLYKDGVLISGGDVEIEVPDNDDAVAFVVKSDGTVLVQGVSFVQQADGSILWDGAVFTKQDDGSVIVS